MKRNISKGDKTVVVVRFGVDLKIDSANV